MHLKHIFKNDLKVLGLTSISNENIDQINGSEYNRYIKVLYLPKGYKLTVDLTEYTTNQTSVFFVGPGQYFQIHKTGTESAHLIFYNQDFYCIQIHDHEVACDGLLYRNMQNVPMITIHKEEINFINYLFEQMQEEFELHDNSMEEMLRTYLKQLFIRSVRVWKKQHLDKEQTDHKQDLDFFRKFTILVDIHYKEKHSVADYADLLYIASKTITHKFKRLNLPQPNEVIKNRIVLEAKRLLAHTSMTAKEIAYELGYEDPAYFSRTFMQKTGESPSGFRTKYLAV